MSLRCSDDYHDIFAVLSSIPSAPWLSSSENALSLEAGEDRECLVPVDGVEGIGVVGKRGFVPLFQEGGANAKLLI